ELSQIRDQLQRLLATTPGSGPTTSCDDRFPRQFVDCLISNIVRAKQDGKLTDEQVVHISDRLLDALGTVVPAQPPNNSDDSSEQIIDQRRLSPDTACQRRVVKNGTAEIGMLVRGKRTGTWVIRDAAGGTIRFVAYVNGLAQNSQKPVYRK